SFIMGMAKAKDSVKILLNIDSVLSTEEVMDLSAVGAA
ncbi:MAG: chemotaxis protein CheW, partial [Proteobacteria bacterium]|nr:chemotaxis protein CheW [Pseudomonadota bacterium]